GASTLVAADASGIGWSGWQSLRCVRDGRRIRARRRPVLGAGDGGRSDLGEYDQERDPGIRLSVRVLTGDVCAAGSGRTVQRHGCALAEGGWVDGLGQATVCADHVGRRGVLPCPDGPASHLTLRQLSDAVFENVPRHFTAFATRSGYGASA